MKTYWSDTLIDFILAFIFIPSVIGVVLLKIFIDDVCTCGTRIGDKRRFRRIVG